MYIYVFRLMPPGSVCVNYHAKLICVESTMKKTLFHIHYIKRPLVPFVVLKKQMELQCVVYDRHMVDNCSVSCMIST